MIDKIRKWEKLSDEIVELWIRDYFELTIEKEVYYEWVTVGGVFNFADYWFDLNIVFDCYELGVSKEQLFLWYDKSLSQEIDMPLSEFILSPKKLKEQQEKHLEELKERVKTAGEELKKALDEYIK